MLRKVLWSIYRLEHVVYCLTGTRVEMLLHRMYYIGLRRRYARLLGSGEDKVRQLLKSGTNEDLEEADAVAQGLGLYILDIDLFLQTA